MSYKDKLSGMQSNWSDSQNAYDSMFGGIKIEPGQYIARLQSAKVVESKSTGKLMVRREHVILQGEMEGMVVFDNLQLETPMGLTFLRRWFDQMGYESPADSSEIEDTIAAINKDAATVKILVKHSGDFVNVSVIEVMEESETTAEEPKAKTKEKTKAKEKEEEEETEQTDTADDTEDAELVAKLFAFCKAQDIETEKDDTLDVLCERIGEYDWPKEELTEEELDMFKSADLMSKIIEPVKPKKKVKRS